jgi:hypothetical protein
MMWEFFTTALVSAVLMGFVVYKQIKELVTDGPLTWIKIALFVMGVSIFLTSIIGVYYHLSRTGLIPQTIEPITINRINSWGRLAKAYMLYLIYWKFT